MTSHTKTLILQRHQQNVLLNALAPPLMPRGEDDLSADDFAAPIEENIIAATAEALDSGQTHYVDVPGIAPLRAAIADYLRGAMGAPYQIANVIVTAGIQESRFLTLQMIGEQFERIALPAVVHPGVRRAVGVRPMPVETLPVDADTGLLPTLEGIRKALEGGVRLLYLESPSRLTGAVYSTSAVEALASLVGQYKATVIWDQGLAPWTGMYTSLAAQSAGAGCVVAIGEAFPGMGLSSWFIGYIAAPEVWIPPMQSQKQIMAICTSTPAQYAALEASKLFADRHANQLARLQQMREALLNALDDTPAEIVGGDAATVLALRFPAPDKQKATVQLREAGYTIADGADFGAPDVVRLSITPSSAAQKAIERLV